MLEIFQPILPFDISYANQNSVDYERLKTRPKSLTGEIMIHKESVVRRLLIILHKQGFVKAVDHV